MIKKFNNDDHNIVDDIKYSGAVTVGAENNYLNSYLCSFIFLSNDQTSRPVNNNYLATQERKIYFCCHSLYVFTLNNFYHIISR